jgi:methylmalonyl-CoA/ethylmalonyl-CoA epimerase
MIKGIGHVRIIVKNLEEAVNLYCRLFCLEKPAEFKEYPSEGMKNAMLQLGTQTLELMEPYPGTSLSKFLENHGEGLHHINLIVDDLDSTNKSLKAGGATLIERGSNATFVHPKSTKGVLLEIMKSDRS